MFSLPPHVLFGDTWIHDPGCGRERVLHAHQLFLVEAARMLRPGGAFVYDTVNRTPVSRLIYLGAFQRR